VKRLIFIFLGFFWSLSAFGAAMPAVVERPEPPSVIFSLMRVVGSLALVLALFFGAVYLFKNWQKLVARQRPASKLQVMEVKSLGPRQALYVIGYEERRMLVGASPAGLTLLGSLPHADSDAAAENNVSSPGTFADLLLKTIRR
jgi:flagellar biogenesis protein FliO